MLTDFQCFGRELFLTGLNNSHSGNLSMRCGNRIVITRKGSMLGNLTVQDIIETGLDKNDEKTALASTEIGVHRSIYRGTTASAIVHAHPIHAIALSLIEDLIIPVDAEGAHFLPKVPVLDAINPIGSKELEKNLPPLLRDFRIVLVRGHGSFAVGQNLEEAYQWTTCLENVCRIICLSRILPGTGRVDAKTVSTKKEF